MVDISKDEKVDISIVCAKGYFNDPLIVKIRSWAQEPEDRISKAIVGDVVKEQNLESAVEVVRDNPGQTILVTIGFPNAEVSERLNSPESKDWEVVVCKSGDGIPPSRPSASLLDPSRVEANGEVVPLIRKAILRQLIRGKYTVEPLTDREELENYFALRYRVWKEMDYLPTQCDCRSMQLELNYTDRFSHPIGVFSATDRTKMLGCGRLVRGYGHENSRLRPVLTEIVEDHHDDCLKRSFELPQRSEHPFDMLESFQEFMGYFRDLVQARVSKAEVSRVIVDPAHQGSGLGEIIVDSLVHEAQRMGIARLFLACVKARAPFYSRSGFVRIPELGECANFVGVGVPAVAMHIERLTGYPITCRFRKLYPIQEIHEVHRRRSMLRCVSPTPAT